MVRSALSSLRPRGPRLKGGTYRAVPVDLARLFVESALRLRVARTLAATSFNRTLINNSPAVRLIGLRAANRVASDVRVAEL